MGMYQIKVATSTISQIIHLISGIRFTNGTWAYDPNLLRIRCALMRKIMVRSGHNFAHVMTAQQSSHVKNLWHDVVLRLITKAKKKSKNKTKQGSENSNRQLRNHCEMGPCSQYVRYVWDMSVLLAVYCTAYVAGTDHSHNTVQRWWRKHVAKSCDTMISQLLYHL